MVCGLLVELRRAGRGWSCWAHPSGNTYLGLATSGPTSSTLTQVRVTYTVPTATADQNDAKAYFATLATITYRGARPSDAHQWLKQMWDRASGPAGAKVRIGGGRFELHIVDGKQGSDYSLDLYPVGESFE